MGVGVRLSFELPPHPTPPPPQPTLGKASSPEELRVPLGSRKALQAAGLASSQPPSPLCSQLQELLEYMRKLEARLEKVADEKWNEDAVTEDEEAAVGPSLYTPSLVTPLPPPVSPVGESCM